MNQEIKPYDSPKSDVDDVAEVGSGLTAGSAFKFTFLTSGTGVGLLFIVQSLVTFFLGGESSFTFNGESANTTKGLIYSFIALPFIIGICGGFLAVLAVIGQWVYMRFAPLKLRFAKKA
jgi:hypothetical protein